MWYKQATSMGMYLESISKTIGQVAIKELRKKDSSHMVITVGVEASINQTQIPENIKANLIEAFAPLEVVNIRLMSSQILSTNIRIAGAEISWANGRNVIEVVVEFDYKKEIISLLQEIYKAICPVIRHELEHFVQNERINPRNKTKENKPGHNYKNYIQIKDNVYGYYMNKQEIEGHVTQLYMKAKNSKRPFEQVLKEFIDTQAYKILYHDIYESNQLNYSYKALEEFSQTKARTQANEIYKTYLNYAKSRYPHISDIAIYETKNIHAR